MKKVWITAVLWAAAMLLFTACATGASESGADASGITLPAPADSPAGMPARPGSDVTDDPSVNLEDRVEVTGVVREVNGDLVLIDLKEDGGEFMLRFTENTRWSEGVDMAICAGNTVTCVVLPEETFAPPAQGEVLEVLSNAAAG